MASAAAAQQEAPFNALYHSVAGEIARSHPRLKAKVDAKLVTDANQVSWDAGLLGRDDPGVALGTPLAASAQSVRARWDTYVARSMASAKAIVLDPYRELLRRHLVQIVTMNAPELQKSKAKIDALMAESRWFEAADELPRLTELFREPAALWKDITERQTALAYLAARAITPAEHTDVANWNVELAAILTKPLAEIPEEIRKFDPNLVVISDRVAQGEFQGTPAQKLQALEDLFDNKIIRRGSLNKKYPTTWDTKNGYSVEYNIVGYNTIVVHAHCKENGTPTKVHWKYRSHKFDPRQQL